VPAILRTEVASDAKLLTIAEENPPLRGYRCFLALSDRVRMEKGDFFLQPHKTSVAWGGQKVMLIFQHHSGRFGLYYDIQTPGLVAESTGGDNFPTCTIVLKDRVFVPIPEAIRPSFMPSPGERKRLEVKCDIIYIDTDAPN
jgi:molecular chaperone HtpG